MPHHLPFRCGVRPQLCWYAPPPAPAPSRFPLLLFLASTDTWIGQLLFASPLCPFVIKRPAASTTPRYQIPLFLAALDHSTLFTLNSKGELSVDPSGALNAVISSARDWAQFVSGGPCSGLSPHQPSSRTSRDGPAAQLSPFLRLPRRGVGLCG